MPRRPSTTCRRTIRGGFKLAWLRGGRWPKMPFNQQWSFPVEMTLHTQADGPTVFRYPIREIEKLWDEKL